MNAMQLILTVATSATVAAAFTFLAGPPEAPAEPIADLDVVTARLDELAAAVRELDEREGDAAPRPAAVRQESIEAVVRRVLGKDGQRAADVSGAAADAKEDSASLTADPAGAVAAIRAAKLDSHDARAIWSALEEADQLDAVLALFRADAEKQPNSAPVQFELARALHAAAIARPNHAEGSWWYESDNTFGRVLELDPDHWEARYRKATNLTFWPDVYGRLPEAIRHFETLMDKQERLAPVARHKRVYVELGNVLAQHGEPAKAATVWKRGLKRFPNDADLRKRLDAAGR